MVPRVPSPRPSGRHNHTPSYQCFVDLPGLHPPKFVEATQHPLEDRQHHSLGLCQERRGELQSASPGDPGEDSGQEIPDWQLHPSVFRAITARWGSPSIDLFASCASKQTQRFFSWDTSHNPEAVDALSQEWDFTLAYAFLPIPLLKSGEEAGDVEGHLHPGLSPMGSPDMASFASFADSDGGLPASVHRQPNDESDDEETAPILHNLHLAV
jgi:hypothetical protein